MTENLVLPRQDVGAKFIQSFRRDFKICAELAETECPECVIYFLLLGISVEIWFQLIDCRGRRLQFVIDGS